MNTAFHRPSILCAPQPSNGPSRTQSASSRLDDDSAGGQRAKEERVLSAARAFAEAQLAPDKPAVVAISGTPTFRPDLRESWMVRVESASRRLMFVEVILDADGTVETRRYRT